MRQQTESLVNKVILHITELSNFIDYTNEWVWEDLKGMVLKIYNKPKSFTHLFLCCVGDHFRRVFYSYKYATLQSYLYSRPFRTQLLRDELGMFRGSYIIKNDKGIIYPHLEHTGSSLILPALMIPHEEKHPLQILVPLLNRTIALIEDTNHKPKPVCEVLREYLGGRQIAFLSSSPFNQLLQCEGITDKVKSELNVVIVNEVRKIEKLLDDSHGNDHTDKKQTIEQIVKGITFPRQIVQTITDKVIGKAEKDCHKKFKIKPTPANRKDGDIAVKRYLLTIILSSLLDVKILELQAKMMPYTMEFAKIKKSVIEKSCNCVIVEDAEIELAIVTYLLVNTTPRELIKRLYNIGLLETPGASENSEITSMWRQIDKWITKIFDDRNSGFYEELRQHWSFLNAIDNYKNLFKKDAITERDISGIQREIREKKGMGLDIKDNLLRVSTPLIQEAFRGRGTFLLRDNEKCESNRGLLFFPIKEDSSMMSSYFMGQFAFDNIDPHENDNEELTSKVRIAKQLFGFLGRVSVEVEYEQTIRAESKKGVWEDLSAAVSHHLKNVITEEDINEDNLVYWNEVDFGIKNGDKAKLFPALVDRITADVETFNSLRRHVNWFHNLSSQRVDNLTLVDLKEEVQAAVKVFETNIDVQFDIDGNIKLCLQPYTIEIMIEELIRNAIKGQDPEVRIEIHMDREHEKINVAISNRCSNIETIDFLKRLAERSPREMSGSGWGVHASKMFVRTIFKNDIEFDHDIENERIMLSFYIPKMPCRYEKILEENIKKRCQEKHCRGENVFCCYYFCLQTRT